jgi:hypothetical protein
MWRRSSAGTPNGPIFAPDRRGGRLLGGTILNHREATEAFFVLYGRRSSDALGDPPVEDIDGIVSSFAPYVVGSNPKGVMGGPASDLRTIIPQGFAQYRRVGGKAMRVTRVKATELDNLHVQARVDWEFDYERPSDGRKGTITFQNIYFLSFAMGSPKVFASITPDEQRAMKDHGLI